MQNKRQFFVAENKIDFGAAPFIKLESGQVTIRSSYHRFPVFQFPHGVPAVGDAVRVYISSDTRRDRPKPVAGQNIALTEGGTRDDLFARKQVIRILRGHIGKGLPFALELLGSTRELEAEQRFEWFNPHNEKISLRIGLFRLIDKPNRSSGPLMPPVWKVA